MTTTKPDSPLGLVQRAFRHAQRGEFTEAGKLADKAKKHSKKLARSSQQKLDHVAEVIAAAAVEVAAAADIKPPKK